MTWIVQFDSPEAYSRDFLDYVCSYHQGVVILTLIQCPQICAICSNEYFGSKNKFPCCVIG